MNKKRNVGALFANKRVKKSIGVFLILAVIGICSVFGMNSFKDKKEEVSAHPTNTIRLDEGGANEFEIPINASNLVEQSLIDKFSPSDGYVQGNSGTIPILTKGKVDAFWSNPVNIPELPVGWAIRDVRKTQGGNYFVLLGAGGTNVGGVVCVCIINSSGECLYKSAQGDLKAVADRVDTKLFSIANGTDFLVGTSGENYYRYTLSAETTNSVTVARKSVAVTSGKTPKEVLGVGYLTIADSTLNDTTQTFLAGGIYFDDRTLYNGKASVLFRVPIGTLFINGWNSATSSFQSNAKHEYSLATMIPPNAEDKSKTKYGYVSVDSTTITSDHVYGIFQYVAGDPGKGMNKRTVQIFDKTKSIVEHGKEVKPIRAAYENDYRYGKIYMIDELCTEDEIYFFSREQTESKLIRMGLGGTYPLEVIKTYPANTILNFVENPDDPTQLFYFGSASSLTGELYHPVLSTVLTGNNFYVQGIVEADFDRKSIYAFPIDTEILPDFMKQGDGKALIFGQTDSINKRFIDEHHRVEETGTIYSNSIPATNKKEAFLGVVEAKDDYPPAIKVKNNIDINLADADLKSTDKNAFGWTCLDNWLITGSKNGNLDDTNSVNVFDHMDSANIDLGQTWLEKRINRNPKNITADIEWEKLGFDINKAGPQEVTYFVTDSEWQTSTVSRLINKKTPQTFEEDDYVFDAQNFHVPLNGIDTTIPNANKFKEFAKTMAWNQETGDIDEDGTDSSKLSGKVEVDAAQLKTLREATVAKPYPVDVTYKPKAGIEIKNRVWVFVTTKNTLPNSETNPKVTPVDTNGVVYYADDYSLPFRLRGVHTDADILDRGNVRVYDYYDSTHETAAELPVLADKTTNFAKLQVVKLNAINSAAQPGLIDSSPPDGAAMIRYEWDGPVDGNHQLGTTKPTLGGLDVTLTGDILINVRQVVVGGSNQLVVPEEGYLRMATNDYDGLLGATKENADQLRQVRISSGKNTDNPAFETIAMNVDHMDDPLDELDLKLIIPEYYEIVGNYLTLGRADPNGASHVGKTEADKNWASLIFQRDDLYNDEEYFITIYLKPKLNQEGPQPYSWDYKKNDLGKIKTK
ncbi:hypothetical protein [Candidatus Enterococcus ferrettii]|uniref:Uncharacterized protein n=1 Tax=Candidatus Enterococcus ferrettii TaxID=2815324 RepID=A0ABV0ELZ3_9ENTE|nr:hypothetical protein [Enterococcus sp. 665A]MBO1339031.1 hypothetical protein [Enterococcus sp. 665A]